MSIILEGPDNAGKTSLAKDLQALNPELEYYHAGSAPKDEAFELQCMEHQWREANKAHVIVDRLTCISQQIYHDGNLFLDKYMMELQKYVMTESVIIVYCRPSTDRLMRVRDMTFRAEESEEWKQKVIARQHEFIERYDSLMSQTPHIHYDFEDETAAAWVRKWVANAATNMGNRAWLRANVYTGGSYAPLRTR